MTYQSWSEREEELRIEQERYRGDVTFDVWRSGCDPDRVDWERVNEAYYDGMSHDDAAAYEIRQQEPSRDDTEDFER